MGAFGHVMEPIEAFTLETVNVKEELRKNGVKCVRHNVTDIQ